MSAALVFIVFGAIIALLWAAVFWLDPDRRIAEAFDAAQVRHGDELMALADAVGVSVDRLDDEVDAEWRRVSREWSA